MWYPWEISTCARCAACLKRAGIVMQSLPSVRPCCEVDALCIWCLTCMQCFVHRAVLKGRYSSIIGIRPTGWAGNRPHSESKGHVTIHHVPYSEHRCADPFVCSGVQCHGSSRLTSLHLDCGYLQHIQGASGVCRVHAASSPDSNGGQQERASVQPYGIAVSRSAGRA